MWERGAPEDQLRPFETPEQSDEWIKVLTTGDETGESQSKFIGGNLVIYHDGEFFNAPGKEIIRALREYEIKEGLTEKNDRGWMSSRPGWVSAHKKA